MLAALGTPRCEQQHRFRSYANHREGVVLPFVVQSEDLREKLNGFVAVLYRKDQVIKLHDASVLILRCSSPINSPTFRPTQKCCRRDQRTALRYRPRAET